MKREKSRSLALRIKPKKQKKEKENKEKDKKKKKKSETLSPPQAPSKLVPNPFTHWFVEFFSKKKNNEYKICAIFLATVEPDYI